MTEDRRLRQNYAVPRKTEVSGMAKPAILEKLEVQQGWGPRYCDGGGRHGMIWSAANGKGWKVPLRSDQIGKEEAQGRNVGHQHQDGQDAQDKG